MRRLFLIVCCLISGLTWAQNLIEFENGRIADADDINENFRLLKEAMGSATSGCSARQAGSDVIIDCVNGSSGVVGPGGELTSIEPYAGASPVFLDCNDVGDFIEQAINLRLAGDNFLGFISAADFPSMNQDAEKTLKDLMLSVFSLDIFGASYANRYLARWATEQAVRETRRGAVKSCYGDGWFEQLEASDLVYEPENASGVLRQISVTINGGGAISSFPQGIVCRDNCTASFPEGTDIILRARPDEAFSLSGWSGACSGSDTACLITLNQNRQVDATFVEAPWKFFTISIASLGDGESSEIYSFNLADDATELEVYMTGGVDGDADLYVSSDEYWNNYGSWQCGPELDGTSEEACLTDALRPLDPGGTYLIGVYGYTAVSGITITVRYR